MLLLSSLLSRSRIVLSTTSKQRRQDVLKLKPNMQRKEDIFKLPKLVKAEFIPVAPVDWGGFHRPICLVRLTDE